MYIYYCELYKKRNKEGIKGSEGACSACRPIKTLLEYFML
jgi:hypothetical protein